MTSLKKNFMYQIIWQLLSMILPLATSPILARILGAEGIGTYAYIYSIVSYFYLFANLGIYKYGAREIAKVRKDKNKLSSVFGEIYTLHIVISILVGGIYIVYALFFSEYPIQFGIMSAFYLGNILNINWLYAGMEDFKKITFRDIFVKLFTFMLIVICIHTKDDLTVYVFIMALSSFIGSLIYWFYYKEYINIVKVSLKKTISHWKGMLTLFIPVLLESIYTTMDKIMLGVMTSKITVGYYENAEKALIANRIIHALSVVLTPHMTNLIVNKNEKKIEELMKRSVDISIILSVAFAFGTAAVAKEFSIIFWGSDFIKSAPLIVILALSMPGMALSRIIREGYLLSADEDKKYILSAGAGACINLAGNLILIPYYGAIGAAIATLVSEYTVLIVQMIGVRKELPIARYIKENLIFGVFGIIMYVSVRFIGAILGIHLYTLLLEILCGSMIYAACSFSYWKITGQKYYISMFMKIIKRK